MRKKFNSYGEMPKNYFRVVQDICGKYFLQYKSYKWYKKQPIWKAVDKLFIKKIPYIDTIYFNSIEEAEKWVDDQRLIVSKNKATPSIIKYL